MHPTRYFDLQLLFVLEIPSQQFSLDIDHTTQIDSVLAYDTDNNPWMRKDDPHLLEGMAGQLLTIRGRGFEPVIERTDDNYYKDLHGWFNQRDLTQTYIGERPCLIHYANDTLINCTIFYQDPNTPPEPIKVKTYGKVSERSRAKKIKNEDARGAACTEADATLSLCSETLTNHRFHFTRFRFQ